MSPSTVKGAPGGRVHAGWIRGAALAGLLLSGRALAITSQDFTNPGTSYVASACAGAPAPAILSPGPGGVGNFMRLLTVADTSASNSVSFDRSDGGSYTRVTADFDFRITSGVGRGEGFGFALLSTATNLTTGSVCGGAEEPNFPGSLGIGFDLHQDAGDLNNNEVSVHWNNAVVQQFDATPITDLASGQWIHATIVARPGGGFSDVSIQLTPSGGAATSLVSNLAIPGFTPYEARGYFCARSSTETANYDLANVQIQFAADPAYVGQWSPTIIPTPVIPIHSVMMPSGKIICWDRGSNGGTDTNPRLLDPANNFAAFKTSFPGVEMFCCGMTLRSDGKMLQAGGHLSQDGDGRITSFMYDEGTDTWTQLQDMNLGRWYPTLINLNNGDSVVMSGTYSTSSIYNTLPQVMQAATGTWRSLTTAVRTQSLYPMLHLAPDGRVYQSGPDYDTYLLDTSGTGTWTGVANSHEVSRNYGNSVLYGQGKVILIGGGSTPVNTAEVINLTDATPTWRLVAPMSYARRQQSALLLPDGTILVTGGTPSGLTFNDATNANLAPELWDPVSETWQVLTGCQLFRLYHSETVLLQDGRVASL
ncbi:MAG TPA: hypothetical protein VKW04_23025, partial [Planctomycetota bacterium]|nr:hypothetical protein [Planctomycetota bacterium]